MAKATIEIDDQFTFTWDKTTIGSEEQKRRIPEFVKEFLKKIYLQDMNSRVIIFMISM